MQKNNYTQLLEFKNYNYINSSSENNIINGYASVFNVIDTHNDIIMPGAFTKSINAHFTGSKRIALLWQHMVDKPIGKIQQLQEDEYGLYLTAEILDNIHHGREALELIKSNTIYGLSIGFNPIKSYINNTGERIIEEIELWEISLVTFPANQWANITQLKANNTAILALISNLEKALKSISIS
jgi:HK97 family phage prohead protease